MPPRKKKQKTEHVEGHTPLDIPATKNAGWSALSEKMQAHTKGMKISSSATGGSRAPETDNEYFGPRFDYEGAGIRNPFDGAVSASTAIHSLILPPGVFNQTGPVTAVAMTGQMDPEQSKQHKSCAPGCDVAGGALMCGTSAGDSNFQMGKSGTGTEVGNEGGGTGGGEKYQTEDVMSAD